MALSSNTVGNVNTATGLEALRDNIDGEDNTANGYRALFGNTTGDNNTAIGVLALSANTSGAFNTALGRGGRRWRKYGQQCDCYRHQCREREQQLLYRPDLFQCLAAGRNGSRLRYRKQRRQTWSRECLFAPIQTRHPFDGQR